MKRTDSARLQPGTPGDAVRLPSMTSDDFAAHYQRYFAEIFSYLARRVPDKDLAQDLTAEVFERAFTKLTALHSQSTFRPWLFTIARNLVVTYWRRQRPVLKGLVDLDTLPQLSHASPEELLLRQERSSALLKVVEQLPQRQQDLLALKFGAGLSSDEIARAMGLSSVNVRVILHRTLRKLRQQDHLELDGKVSHNSQEGGPQA